MTGKKITVEAFTTVDDVQINKMLAVIKADDKDTTFYNQQLDKNACKDNRDLVRSDRAEFEDFVYKLADNL